MGAYGFSFSGVDGPLLESFPKSWPETDIRQQLGAEDAVSRSLADLEAEFPLLDGGSVLVRRDPRCGVYRVPSMLSSDEIAHPYLVPVAAVHAYWNGYATFHAGGFIVDGKVWAILASRRGGKSSLLAALAKAGYGIVSDDLVVTDEERVFSGPRSIDLREDAVPNFPGTRSLGMAGRRPRWRLEPGDVPSELPLAGWLTLDWSDEMAMWKVEPGERIRLLAESRSLKGPAVDPSQFLRLTGKPMWTVGRPRGWELMDQTLNLLLETIS